MPNILVIDDSKTIRKVIQSILEPEGHVVTEASDGLEGLEKFKEIQDLALVITDVNMPNMDGITMCEQLRQFENGKKVPIFIVSTEGSPELKARAKAAGVMAWMTKPPQPNKIIEAVRVIMSKRAA